MRQSRLEYVPMMLGTTKPPMSASRSSVVAPVVTASVLALGILIIGGVLLLILGAGHPM